ncbi:MAG: T9SS type A sorting domain-containing protein [Ignavibacteria bacterium]|nr:T9SS type A sorting domain-containing protein [Ignavibacteria bacterium]
MLYAFAVLAAMMPDTSFSQSGRTLAIRASDALQPVVASMAKGAAMPASSGIALTAVPSTLARLRAAERVQMLAFPLSSGTSADFELERFSIFNEHSMIVAMGADGPVRRPLPDITLYRGRVRGEPRSWVYLAVERDGMSGTVISSAGHFTVALERAASVQNGAAPVVRVMETTGDMAGYQCGVTDDDEIAALASSMKNDPSFTASSDTLLAQIAIDADLEAYQHYKTVAATENYITARMGESSAIYERDLAITLKVPFLRVWTTKDPFPGTSDSELLNVFSKYWKENMDTVSRTLAVMISCKPISAAGVSQGLAWLDVLCRTDRGTAFVKFSMNDNFISGHVGVLAHEIGHNFGSPHTHSCLWNPAVDSCYTAEPKSGQAPCFTAGEQHLILGGGELMSYCHMRYGNGAKLNIYRDRVGSHVRSRAEAAECISATSIIRSLTLTAPLGGGATCAGTAIDVTWEASGNNDFIIHLSRDGGATYDTVLVDGLPRTVRKWTWNIPGNFAPGANYRIRIKDKKNETLVSQMPAVFEIKKGVFIIDQTLWRNVCVGEGVSFDVTASGSGTLRYQWKRNGVDLAGQNGPGITLQNMQMTDNLATFTCMVYGDCGAVESKPALLKVFTKPVILKQPNNDTVCVGGTATITIEADGPFLTYRWFEMPGGKIYDVNKPEFIVTNVTAQKAYYCEVTSPCGKSTTQSGFVIVPQPSVAFVTPKPFQELTATDTFHLRWSYFCLTSVKLEYSLDGGAAWTTIENRVTASDRTYAWKVPSTETNNGQFRITDADAPSRTVISAIFRIRRRPLPVYSSSDVNFGLVQVGTTASKTITLENTGLSEMTVTRAAISGTTDVVFKSPAAFTVQVNERYDLTFEYSPLIAGPLSGVFVLEHNGLPATDTMKLVGDAFLMVSASNPAAPATLALLQNHPNPVLLGRGATTQLTFDLPQAGQARLAVFNLLGQEVSAVAEGFHAAGRHAVTFDASALSPGNYLIRLSAGGETRTRVMHVIR